MGEAEGVKGTDNLQEALKVVGHVITAGGADVLNGLGCC